MDTWANLKQAGSVIVLFIVLFIVLLFVPIAIVLHTCSAIDDAKSAQSSEEPIKQLDKK